MIPLTQAICLVLGHFQRIFEPPHRVIALEVFYNARWQTSEDEIPLARRQRGEQRPSQARGFAGVLLTKTLYKQLKIGFRQKINPRCPFPAPARIKGTA